MRPDGRNRDELREIAIEQGFTDSSPGSVLISYGRTKVLCTASPSTDVPRWLRGGDKGWVSAEYSMLPGSSNERVSRERRGPKGRTQEIERLVARSLRAGIDLRRLGERQVMVDCDVLQADGGTRTASITGGWLALAESVEALISAGELRESPITDQIAAVSVGIVDGEVVLDLPYSEDSNAEVDANVVMTGAGRIIEVQATAEDGAFDRDELNEMLDVAQVGLNELFELQRQLLGEDHPVMEALASRR